MTRTCEQCGRDSAKPRQLSAWETVDICEACLVAAKRDVLDMTEKHPSELMA